MTATADGWRRVGSDSERTLVTHSPEGGRIALFVAAFVLLGMFHAALHYGRVRYVCDEGADGRVVCDVETDAAFEHQTLHATLTDPMLTVIAGNGGGSLGELHLGDSGGSESIVVSAPTHVAIDVADELRACLADAARIHCAGDRSNAHETIVASSILFGLLIVIMLVPALGTRTTLVADRARGELRVHRRLAFVPRKTLVMTTPSAVRVVLRAPEGRSSWAVRLMHADGTATPLAASWDRAKAETRLSQVTELIAWLCDQQPQITTSSGDASAWDPESKTLRPGIVPIHERAASSSRRGILARLAILAAIFLFGSASLALSSPMLSLEMLGLTIVIVAPFGYFVHRLAERSRARAEAELVVETEGVSCTKGGVRRLVPWSEVASVQEYVFGRYTFRDAAGATLFEILVVTDDDAKMAKAMAAAARTGRLSENGSTASVEIGAAAGWALALVGGPVVALFGLAMLFRPSFVDPPPRLEELEHRAGVVVELERVMSSSGTVQFHLEGDDVVFYIVRGRDHAQAVLDTMRVGDEIEIWVDREEPLVGPVGVVFQMRIDDQILFSVDQADEAVGQSLETSLALVASGVGVWVLGMLVQRRRAIVKLR